MTDEEGVRLTLALHCQLVDEGRFDEWANLYADDATFTVGDRTHEGRDALKAFMEKAQPPERRGKHMCANPVIEVEPSQGRATARTDYIFVARAGEGGFAITSVGRYHDRLVRSPDGRWRFTERRIAFLG